MKKFATVLTATSFVLLGCGGASPAPTDTAAPTPVAAEPEPALTALDCSKPPQVLASMKGADSNQAFTATDSERGTEKGTTRAFHLGNLIISSHTEGGSNSVALHGLNDCGLWLTEVYRGSIIGGDPDVEKTTITLVKGGGGTYLVERLNVKLAVAVQGDDFTATLVEAIPVYEGE